MKFAGYTDWINISSTKWVQRSQNLFENSKNEIYDTKNVITLLDLFGRAILVTDKNTIINIMGFYITFGHKNV